MTWVISTGTISAQLWSELRPAVHRSRFRAHPSVTPLATDSHQSCTMALGFVPLVITLSSTDTTALTKEALYKFRHRCWSASSPNSILDETDFCITCFTMRSQIGSSPKSVHPSVYGYVTSPYMCDVSCYVMLCHVYRVVRCYDMYWCAMSCVVYIMSWHSMFCYVTSSFAKWRHVLIRRIMRCCSDSECGLAKRPQ